MPVRRREGLSLIAAALICAALLWPVVLFAELPQAVVNGVTDEPWKGEYKYDAAGNIKEIGPSNHYLYDGAMRLVEATAKTNLQSDVRNYSYDAFGNLRQIQTNHDATHAWIFAVDPQTNRMDGEPDCSPGTTCFFATYDSVTGHQLTGPDNAHYDYDAVDMLTALTTGTRNELYIYDANDQRIATITNANTTPAWRYTLRDLGSNVIRVWTSSGNSWSWTEDYVHRDGVLLASITDSPAGEQRSHFHVDHLNSPRLITDDEGRKISVHTYWPFGLEAYGSDLDNERRKYTGHERDFAGTGNINDLDYMHARYYAPVENRFLSLDPFTDVTLALKEPQRWNRFTYVRDSPLRYTDPDGRDMRDFFNALGPAAKATGRDLARIGGNMIHAPEVQEAVQGFKSGDAKERVMASAVILLAVADVAANVLQPEKAEIQAVGKAAVKETAVMIGHLGPELEAAAEKAGAGLLHVNTKLTGQAWSWKANKAWINEAIESGRDILLAIDPSKVRKGSVLEKEIKYLEKKGFQIIGNAQEGWRLVR